MKFELEAWPDGQRADRIDCVVRVPGTRQQRRLVIDETESEHERELYRFLASKLAADQSDSGAR